MASVTFPAAFGGDGKTYSDDADPNTGLDGLGYIERFVPCLKNAVAMAGYTAQYAAKIDAAAANADRAEDAKGYVEAVANQYQINIIEQFKRKATLVSDFANHDFRIYDGLRTNQVADTDLWTVERATTGSYVDATGKIRIAAINAPRYTYALNPNQGGLSNGVLSESNKTNIITHSENLSLGSKSTGGCSVDSNQEIAPDGYMTADLLKEDSLDTENKKLRIFFPIETGKEYCLSFFVKSSGRQNVMAILNASFENKSIVNFNLSTMFVNKIDQDAMGLLSYDIEPYNDDWFRCHVSATALVTDPSARFELFIKDSDNLSVGPYQGDGESGILLWGLQAENGRKPSSYIKTGSAAVTRSIDIFARSGVNSQIRQNDFSIFAAFTPKMHMGNLFSSSPFYALFELNDGTSNNRIRAVFRGQEGMARDFYIAIVREGFSNSIGFTRLEYGTQYNVGLSISSDRVDIVINGKLILSADIAEGVPTNLSELSLSNGESIEYKNFILLPSAVTAAELETLTAI